MYNLTPFLASISICSALIVCITGYYAIRTSLFSTFQRRVNNAFWIGLSLFFTLCTVLPLALIPRYFENRKEFWQMKTIFLVLFVGEIVFVGAFLVSVRKKRKTTMESGNNGKSSSLLIAVSFFVLLFYILLDIFNLPSKLGVDIPQINTSILGTVVGGIITISIFAITFFCVEQWNVKKRSNQNELAEYLLNYTYNECLKWIDYLEKPKMVEQLVQKTDFDTHYNKKTNPAPYMYFADIPFEYDEFISNCIVNGIMSKDQVAAYLKIKQDYSAYITSRVMFFDAPELYLPLRTNLKKYIEKQREIEER